jgi:seryl-tRNA synthetase
MPDLDVREGLATLGPGMVRLRDRLETRWLAWAADCGAAPMLFPPLMRVEDLERFDYFRNFPHLPLLVSHLRPERLSEVSITGLPGGEAETEDLTPAGWALPSAACYNIYLHLAGTDLNAARYVTTVATCFRNEERYDGLQRLHGFTMREIVCIGTRDEVQDHLRAFKARVTAFGERLGLGLTIEAGSDPFYQPQSGRAVLQQLFPQKEELLYDGSLAIASFNFHRNFFGERCRIRAADGQAAFSGCVAFGIERWLHALLAQHGSPESAVSAVGALGE